MIYCTADTQWPSTAPSVAIVELINEFFALMDSNTKDAGPRLAEDIFTPDGILITPSGTAKGEEGIRISREQAWHAIKMRRHTVLRAYTHDEHGRDLMLIGSAVMGLANGKEISGEFTARMLIDEVGSKTPRIKLYQVWADSAPISKALQSS